jgi:type I restriction enzyme S subunit
MNRYQSYKPSGVEWIGEIPIDWKIGRLGYFSNVFRGSGYQYLNQVEDDFDGHKEKVVRIGDITDFNPIWFEYLEQFENYRIKKNDILVGGTGHYFGKSIFVTEEMEGLIHSYNIIRLVIKNQHPKFIQYYISSPQIREQMDMSVLGSGQPFIDLQGLKDITITIPLLQEQLQIVQFLDEKTELIDKLVSTKERKITLLKEQRTTLINQVVTKGLNPNVRMKDSGVEWIGDIPEGWRIGKLKHNSELNISSVDKHIFDDEISVRVCNYTDVYYNEFISNNLELRIGSCSTIEYNKFLLKKGDVIITKDSESPSDIGVPSLVIDELENVVCGYHLSIIKSNLDSLIGEYLFRQLQTTRVRRYFEVNSNGITRFGLGKSSVLELPLILPSVREQIEIVNHLNSKTKEIDDLVSLEQMKIDLLKEYRQSLISEVVTGKIKVTN